MQGLILLSARGGASAWGQIRVGERNALAPALWDGHQKPRGQNGRQPAPKGTKKREVVRRGFAGYAATGGGVEAAAAAGGAGGPAGGGGEAPKAEAQSAHPADDNVVDAEFKEVRK